MSEDEKKVKGNLVKGKAMDIWADKSGMEERLYQLLCPDIHCVGGTGMIYS